jgi:hypothetical protein
MTRKKRKKEDDDDDDDKEATAERKFFLSFIHHHFFFLRHSVFFPSSCGKNVRLLSLWIRAIDRRKGKRELDDLPCSLIG